MESEAAAFQNSACIAWGYTPVNPQMKAKYLSTSSSHEDMMPESDADQTWGKFRQGKFGSPHSELVLQMHWDSLADV